MPERPIYPFRWFYRPEHPGPLITMPMVSLHTRPEVPEEEIPGVFAEINERQWGALQQIMLEAKTKAEAMLRDERVISDLGRLAHYTGWVVYADYVLASLETLREQGRGSPIAE